MPDITASQAMEKWKKVLEHEKFPSIEDFHKKSVTAIILENQRIAAEQAAAGSGGYKAPTLLGEAAPTNAMGASSSTPGDGAIDLFDPVLISLVRRSMPNLISFDVCGVQPMTGPNGLIFAMRSRYTNQSGTEALFNEANTSFSATAAGNTAHQSGNSQYTAQTGDDPSLANATNYTAQGGFDTAFAEALGDSAGNHFQEMAFSIEQVTVTAKSRALKAEYTMELAQDLKAIHGADAEYELANILSAEILADINREIIRKINLSASIGAQQNTATAGVYDLDVDANGRWSVERFKGLIYQIERECNQIAKATRRGKGNLMICSSDVASALAMTGLLEYNPQMNNNLQVDDTGNTFAGMLLGKIKVYIDPYFSTSSAYQYATLGYKGQSSFDAGLFYCPYVPLQMVRAIGEDTFQPKIGFKTRYGLVANPFATTAADGDVAFAKKNLYYRRIGIANIM